MCECDDGKKEREEVDEEEKNDKKSLCLESVIELDRSTFSSPHNMTVAPPQLEFFPRAGATPVSLKGKTLVVVRFLFRNVEK